MAMQSGFELDLGVDANNIDLSNVEEYSNFRAFGIGKETEKQKKRRAKIKKTLNDAGKSISDVANNAGKKIGDKLGGGKAVHALNKFNPVFVTTRGALLSMLNINLFGTASDMAIIKNDKNQQHWNQITQKFWMWGGDKAHIAKSVEKGKNKKALAKNIIDKLSKSKHGFDGYSNAEGKGADNVGTALAVTAALGGATTGILATQPATLAAAPFVGAGSAALAAMSPIFKSYAQSHGATAEQINNIPTQAPAVSIPTVQQAPIINPDTIPLKMPSDPKTLDKVADEMNQMDSAEQKGKDPTLVSAHADPAVDDKILGMKPALFYGLLSVTLFTAGFFIVRKIIKK